ncbi:MrcB family domain-containing protein [Corynebacterium macclintockiae]|uniref:MrcB family domain-containing protein n=1 Tax=Corynebacterium macclintockiae TaxID=2913501 RepID=UPI000553AB31
MKSIFSKILSEYGQAKTQKLAGHPLASYIRKEAVQTLITDVGIETDIYKVSGSAGQGAWAQIPWLSVLDKSITSTPTHGYDIIYLFNADMSGVYLSLNQGWAHFENKYGVKLGSDYIKRIAGYWRRELASSLSDFETKSIDLKAEGKQRPRGYELGHICGIYYPADDLPEDFKMVSDLRNLIGVFRELKGKIGTQGFDQKNAEIIANSIVGHNLETEVSGTSNSEQNPGARKLEERNDTEDASLNDRLLSGAAAKLSLQQAPVALRSIREGEERIARKVDYEAKQHRQRKIGLLAEEAVIDYERRKLRLANRNDLAQKIVHESIEHGDGAGYDILSFTEEGEKLFIEVKATTGSIRESFFLSKNEVQFSGENAENYALYRVYNVSAQREAWGLYILYGDIRDSVELMSTTYMAHGVVSDLVQD